MKWPNGDFILFLLWGVGVWINTDGHGHARTGTDGIGWLVDLRSGGREKKNFILRLSKVVPDGEELVGDAILGGAVGGVDDAPTDELAVA